MACLKAGFFMSALTVEIRPDLMEQLAPPPVIRADRLEQDTWSRKSAARFIGDLALNETVEVDGEKSVTLLSLVEQARQGNSEAFLAVRTNVHTAVVETIYKTGHIMKVEMAESESGGLEQHGHDILDVQANALRYGTQQLQLFARTEVEVLNTHRLLDIKRAGWLQDHYLVFESFFPDNVSAAEAAKAGFFARSRTGVVQAITYNPDTGSYMTEAAFINGEGGEDVLAARRLHARWGDDEAGGTTELLGRPRLVPKSLMPNGVYDYVQMLNEEVPGHDFLDESGDAQAFLAQCAAREANLAATTERVTRRLLDNAERLDSPQAAIQALFEIVGEEAFRHAALDDSVDAHVFGEKAAPLIERGRQLYAAGDFNGAGRILAAAEAVSEPSMCGIGVNNSSDGTSDSLTGEKKTGGTEILECVTCPFCGETVDATKTTDEETKTITIRCPKCKETKMYGYE